MIFSLNSKTISIKKLLQKLKITSRFFPKFHFHLKFSPENEYSLSNLLRKSVSKIEFCINSLIIDYFQRYCSRALIFAEGFAAELI